MLSGGNVDLGVVPGLIRRHETEAGRRLVVFARIDDRPGSLVRFLAVFAAAGANLSRSSTSARASTCTSARPASTPRSRCAAPITPPAVVAAARAAGYDDLRVETPTSEAGDPTTVRDVLPTGR